MYYERTIQTLEQQLKEFQRHLADGGAAGGGGLDKEGAPLLEDVSEADESESDVDLEENRGDLAVAEYVRRSRCAPLASLPVLYV